MGSLMAGWNIPVPDSNTVKYQRNKSLTKEDIEAYRRSNKQTNPELLRAMYLSPKNNEESKRKDSRNEYLQRSSSLPLTDRKGNFLAVDTETAANKLMKTNGWWTRSNWAFLNEPPVIETEEGPRPNHKYSSQYHLTRFGTSKPDSGIST